MQWDDKAQRLLDMARNGHEPSRADADRVRRAFRARWLVAPTLLGAKVAAATGLSFATSTAKTVAAIVVVASVGIASIYGVGVHGFTAHSAEPQRSAPAAGTAHRVVPAVLGERAEGDPGSAPSASDAGPVIALPVAPRAAERRERPPLGSGESTPAPAMPPARRRPTSAMSADLSPELAGLRRAQAALHRGDASAALAALAELDEQSPAGALLEERQATRAIANCALGRDNEAQRAAFLRRFPKSVHATRVSTACASAEP